MMIGRLVNKKKKSYLVGFVRKDLPYETVLIDFHSNARMRHYRNKTVVHVCSRHLPRVLYYYCVE